MSKFKTWGSLAILLYFKPSNSRDLAVMLKVSWERSKMKHVLVNTVAANDMITNKYLFSL